MIRGFKDYVSQSIEADERRLKYYKRAVKTRAKGKLNARYDRKRGRANYYYRESCDNKEKYIPQKPNEVIWKLQRQRFAQEMIKALEVNLQLKKDLKERLISDSYEDILRKLPKAYQPNPVFRPDNKTNAKKIKQSENPFGRDQLKETTSFGLAVRSKGEMLIAELLYSLGIEFYYEKALTLRVPVGQTVYKGSVKTTETVWINKKFYPDFTIPLPDRSEIYWEHKGMLSVENYLERDMEKELAYNLNMIYQPHNLIVTAEGPNNEMDMDAINRIIYGCLMPMLNM